MELGRLRALPTVLLALVVPVVALVAVVVTLNVTSDGSSSASAQSGARSGSAIAIRNFQFSPNPIVVTVGKPVTVTNDDGTVHTLTASDKSFDTGNIEGGKSAQLTITKPGRYRYVCEIHNYMTGTIEAR